MDGDNSPQSSATTDAPGRFSRLMSIGFWIGRHVKAAWLRIDPARRRRICIWCTIIGALLATLQVYLSFGLTQPVKAHVLPAIESATGIKVEAKEVRGDIFGGIRINGLRIANPEGYAEPDAFYADVVKVDLGFLRLLAGVGEISSMRVRGGKVCVVVVPGGKTNVVQLLEKLPESDLPRLLINNCRAELSIQYVDHTLGEKPYEFSYEALVKADDVATYARSTNKWGRFSVVGRQARLPDHFVVDIKGSVAPIVDPATTTFVMDGSVSNMDTRVLEPLAPEPLVRSYPAHLKFHLNCRDGQFQRDATIEAVLNNIRATELGKRKHLSAALPAALTVVVQVRGTLEKPEVDVAGSIRRTLFGSASRGMDNILKATQNALNRFGQATTGRKNPGK